MAHAAATAAPAQDDWPGGAAEGMGAGRIHSNASIAACKACTGTRGTATQRVFESSSTPRPALVLGPSCPRFRRFPPCCRKPFRRLRHRLQRPCLEAEAPRRLAIPRTAPAAALPRHGLDTVRYASRPPGRSASRQRRGHECVSYSRPALRAMTCVPVRMISKRRTQLRGRSPSTGPNCQCRAASSASLPK